MAKKQQSINPALPSELRSHAEKRMEEHHHSTPVSTLSTASSPVEMLKLVHELEVHQIELEMQQEELARTRIELEDSLTLYTDLYDFAPVAYLTLGPDSTVLQANLTATKLLAVDRTRLQGMRFQNLVVPEDHSVLVEFLEELFTKRVFGICEVKLLGDTAKLSTTLQTKELLIIKYNIIG